MTSTSESEADWVATTFTWIDGCETGRVFVGCSWRGWHTEKLHPSDTHEHDDDDAGDADNDNNKRGYTACIKVPPGVHKFQFAVDDKWCHSIHLPTSVESQSTAGTNSRNVCPPPDEPNTHDVVTEFVWLDPAKQYVQLCGAWNSWNPIPMKNVGPNHWTISTSVPVGLQHFRFIVDGVPVHSKRLTIVNDDAEFNLVRIDGPPEGNEFASTGRAGNNSTAASKTNDHGMKCCLVS